jgi:hypothetical protein
MTGEVFKDREPSSLEALWKQLRQDGYVVASDDRLALGMERGFCQGFRDHLEATWFNGGRLQYDPHKVKPYDRERARAVFRYGWQGEDLTVAPHVTADIGDRSYTDVAVRHYPNMAAEMLTDPVTSDWLKAAIPLIPPELRDAHSTFGVNLFRTHTDVVTGPHRDDEKYVLVYVIDKHGLGAESMLYEDGAANSFFAQMLNPGEFLLFDDQRFLHSASPLVPGIDGAPPSRDTVICTFNRSGTYPW